MEKNTTKPTPQPAPQNARAKGKKDKSDMENRQPITPSKPSEELNIKFLGLTYNAKNPGTNTLIITALVIAFLIVLLLAAKPALITGAAAATGSTLWNHVLQRQKGRSP
jgi:hypothetical protein